MFIRKIGLLTAVVTVLLPALASAQEADTSLARIRQNKAVSIGYRETAAPFAYLNESKQASGYSIDICKKVAAEIGRKLNIANIETRYVPVTPQTRIPLIANGTVDIECGTTVNSLARQEQVDFGYAVALAEGKLLVKKTSGIKDLADLNGKIIALASGTTAERYVRTALDANKISARVLQVRDNAEGLLAVNSQRADAFANDAVLLGGALRTAQNKDDATGELQKLYDQWITPYGVPIDGEVDALFKIEAIAE
jgi:glutamate/aspartate transport system substrate-binding protein